MSEELKKQIENLADKFGMSEVLNAIGKVEIIDWLESDEYQVIDTANK